MKDFYSVKELAGLCNVTEQAIRYYLAQNNCAKVAGKWQPTQDELQELFRHYGVDIAQIDANEAQETQSDCATNTKNTTAFAQIAQDDKNAGQEQNSALLDALRSEIEELRQQTHYFQEQNKELLDQNKRLTQSVQELTETNKALAATNAVHVASDKKEALLMEPETVIEEKETESEKVMTFGEWWRQRWRK